MSGSRPLAKAKFSGVGCGSAIFRTHLSNYYLLDNSPGQIADSSTTLITSLSFFHNLSFSICYRSLASRTWPSNWKKLLSCGLGRFVLNLMRRWDGSADDLGFLSWPHRNLILYISERFWNRFFCNKIT